jgi:hypothetical protein
VADVGKDLVALLGLLSQVLPLVGRVRLLRHSPPEEAVVLLTPPEDVPPPLSEFYDAVAEAAGQVGGQLLIGQGRHFVPYRDRGAPRGYDVAGFQEAGGEELVLIGRQGPRRLALAEFEELALADFSLSVACVPGAPPAPPASVYALAPPALYRLLARYFRAHHLRYSLARLRLDGRPALLFEVAPRPGSPTGRSVPAFVLDYLSRLPRVALLVLAHEDAARRIMLQWGHAYPLRLASVAGAFAGELVLLVADHYPNALVHPAPEFFDGELLAALEAPRSAAWVSAVGDAGPAKRLTFPLRLCPDPAAAPPTGALLLTPRELGWLRQLWHRLPGACFSAYSLCHGREVSVLVGGRQSVGGVPFGQPLRRVSDSHLFIPLRSRFVPDLPTTLLCKALAVSDDRYTFLTEEARYDIPVSGFAPLASVLQAVGDRPRVQVTLVPQPLLPELRWTAPAAPPVEVTGGPGAAGKDVLPRPRARPGPGVEPPEGAGPAAAGPGRAFEQADYLRGRAQACEQAGDFLAAAVLYSLLDDPAQSGRCYRRAAGGDPEHLFPGG